MGTNENEKWGMKRPLKKEINKQWRKNSKQ